MDIEIREIEAILKAVLILFVLVMLLNAIEGQKGEYELASQEWERLMQAINNDREFLNQYLDEIDGLENEDIPYWAGKMTPRLDSFDRHLLEAREFLDADGHLFLNEKELKAAIDENSVWSQTIRSQIDVLVSEYQEYRNEQIKQPLKVRPTTGGLSTSYIERTVHYLVNVERQKNGLEYLFWDDELAEIARKHSVDMALNSFFEHDNLLGASPSDRAAMDGYDCYKEYGSYYTEGIGENLYQGWNYRSESIYGIGSITIYKEKEWLTEEEIAENTVEGWMGSEGHRKNILLDVYDRQGIGVAMTSDGKVYITEDFC